MPGYSGLTFHADDLHFVRLDGGGAPLGVATPIASDPLLIHHYALTMRGSDAVVAWIQGTPWLGAFPSGIGLARVAP